MNLIDKRININFDNFLMFKKLLEEFIQTEDDEATKKLLADIYAISLSGSTFIEDVFPRAKKLQKQGKINAVALGVVFFFISRILSQRKEFYPSLNLLREARELFKEAKSQYGMYPKKEITIVKMAIRTSEN